MMFRADILKSWHDSSNADLLPLQLGLFLHGLS
jgi:hypothetical protein